ncbi:hypothetical protein GALL_234550 [mine drainage metagenome]|uniref:Uncharacterized protein n=1 Tax=mine drainage metagenome TaxID=410659 RepID=A0A1J5RER5_9ZZZZ
MRRLTRALFWLIGLPLAVLLVVFALSNRQSLTLAFWPLPDGFVVPAYAAVLLPLLIGLVIGLLAGSARRMAARARASALARRVSVLERDLEAARAAPAPSTTVAEDPAGKTLLPL